MRRMVPLRGTSWSPVAIPPGASAREIMVKASELSKYAYFVVFAAFGRCKISILKPLEILDSILKPT